MPPSVSFATLQPLGQSSPPSGFGSGMGLHDAPEEGLRIIGERLLPALG